MKKKSKVEFEPSQEDVEQLRLLLLEDARKEMLVPTDEILKIEASMGEFFQTAFDMKAVSEVLEENYNVDVEVEIEKQLRWLKMNESREVKGMEECMGELEKLFSDLKATSEVLEEGFSRGVSWPAKQVFEINSDKKSGNE